MDQDWLSHAEIILLLSVTCHEVCPEFVL